MLNTIAANGVAALLMAVTPGSVTSAAQEPVVPAAGVRVVSVNGSGCPAGQGEAVMSADRESFTITSPGYFARAGGGAAPTDFRRNCQFGVQVERAPGWTYAVAGIESSGYAFLARGATGLTRVSAYFQGSSATASWSRAFAGPLADAWQTTDTVDATGLAFASCDTERNLNINTEVRVGAAGASTSSFMVRDSSTTVRLVWRACPA